MKKVIVIAAAVVVPLVAIAAAAPLIISTDIFKNRIAAEFIRWSGREVTYSGAPQISLYPYLSVRLRDAVVADTDGGDEPFVEMEALLGELEILPLLLGRAEVAEFRMVKPVIKLRIDADGRPNWLMPNGAIATQAAKRDAEVASSDDIGPPSPLSEVQLGRLRIRRGTIDFADERNGRHEVLNNVDLEVTWPNTAGAASGGGSFTWRDETVEFNGSVATPLRLLTGGASALRVAVASTPVRFSFDGTAQQLDDLQLDGKVSVTTPSVRRVANWTGATMATGSSLGAGSLSASAKWIGTSLSLTDATVELDGNAAEGAIDANIEDGRLSVRGTLAFGQLDLTPYLEAFRAELFNNGPWLDTPARLPMNDRFDFDVRVSTDALVAGNIHVEGVAASASLKQGRLSVNIGEATFYDGRLESRLTAEMDGGDLVADAEVKADNIPVRPVLADLVGIAAVDGQASGSLEMSSRGDTWGEFVEQLDGEATLDLADGIVSGMDVTELPNLIRDPELSPTSAGSTSFAAANCTITIADGAVAVDTMKVNGAGFAVDLAGKLDLFAPTIEARGILAMLPEAEIEAADPVEVPFMIMGTWAEPRFLPDLGRPIKRSVLDPPVTEVYKPNG